MEENIENLLAQKTTSSSKLEEKTFIIPEKKVFSEVVDGIREILYQGKNVRLWNVKGPELKFLRVTFENYNFHEVSLATESEGSTINYAVNISHKY